MFPVKNVACTRIAVHLSFMHHASLLANPLVYVYQYTIEGFYNKIDFLMSSPQPAPRVPSNREMDALFSTHPYM